MSFPVLGIWNFSFNFRRVQSRLNELDSANAIRSGIFSPRKIQVARSALLDYYGHRFSSFKVIL